MTGTRWTEPGRGATVQEIREAMCGFEGEAFSVGDGRIGRPWRHLRDLALYPGGNFLEVSARIKTNLALTGAPLTAEDLKRIEQAKAGR